MAKKTGHAQMIIPGVGTFVYKNMIAAVNFNEYLKHACRSVLHESLE